MYGRKKRVLVEKPEGGRPLGRHRSRWKVKVKVNLSLEQAKNTRNGSKVIALLFL
jgi:hypothetical protein